MDPKRWKQIDDLVDRALDVPEDEREAFIDARSEGDPELRKAVSQLLAAQNQTNEFLQHSAMKIVAKAIAVDEPSVDSPSLAGKKIATYSIIKKVGSGGMGEVYLAFDEKMRRNVALKILPAEYGSHDERVRRFELEARAISKLNHPNIVTLYDIGNVDGINYIATEFVEGKTLRDLIGGKFKLRNVMANSIQICDALSAAHAQGIIHRDIKPENIMIRKDGYAKILDFGVAKLTEIGPETVRRIGGNTTKGMIIGTPAYMSPSQVSGENVDFRTDIWSCGVVLYEFLTGKNPFKGKNRQATFHAILAADPPPASSINPDLTEDIDRILEKVLQKDPDAGYQTAADLRADLKLVKRELDSLATDEIHSSSSIAIRRKKRARWPLAAGAAAAILLATLIGGYFLFFGKTLAAKGPDWSAATSLPITNQVGIEYFPSLSPDGKDIVYAGQENGQLDIFILRVGAKKAKNLTPGSTEDDTQPAFSPKGDLIAFRSESEPKGIYIVEPSGDNLRRISDSGFHPSFSPDGRQIVVSSWGRDQPTVRAAPGMYLETIDIQSGERRELLKAEATHPAWSPNGHRIAYWFYTGTYGRRDIATIPAGGGEPVVVAKDFAVSNWNPVWSPDGKFLYWVSSRAGKQNFWRIAIDEKTGAVLGDPEPVTTPSSYSRHLTFSADGKRLAYVQTRNTSNIQGLDFDLAAMKPLGEPYWITKGDREIARPELSPDGTRFVLRLIKPTQDDIVTVGRDGNEWRDVTNDEPFDRYVRWAPDSKRLTFGSDRNGGGQTWISNADGTGLKQMTFSTETENSPGFPLWSPDGRRIALYLRGSPFIIDAATGEKVETLPAVPNADSFVAWDWSRDGRKLAGVISKGNDRTLAYYSFDTQTYVPLTPLPFTMPTQWTPDGKHILYSVGRTIFAVDIESKKMREIYKSPDADLQAPFLSPDGKLLYYVAANYESDIWLLDLTEKP